jgi:hypothetical protein
MNERIRELLLQATTLRGPPFIRFKVDQEKFAELIVRECARVAIKKQTENDMDNIVSKNPAKDFAYALIEHFEIK